MSRVLVGFVRTATFMLEKNRLTARLPMPVDGAWQIAAVRQDKLSGDMLITFTEPHNPMVETERGHHTGRVSLPDESKCRFQAQNAH